MNCNFKQISNHSIVSTGVLDYLSETMLLDMWLVLNKNYYCCLRYIFQESKYYEIVRIYFTYRKLGTS